MAREGKAAWSGIQEMSYVDHNPCCFFLDSTITLSVPVSLGFHEKIQLNTELK